MNKKYIIFFTLVAALGASIGIYLKSRAPGAVDMASTAVVKGEAATQTAAHADGLLIQNLDPKGAWALLGLKNGDIVLSLNGEKITTSADFLAKMSRAEKMELKVLRDGKEQLLTYDVK